MEILDEKFNNMPPESIPDFFAGRSVFITGASGFIGKVLLEKLLYSCPRIDAIYMLMRLRKGQDMKQRIKNITEPALFDRIRNECPCVLEKLHCIHGDATKPGLGISPEDRELLQERVSIIYHSAASVRFNDPLSKSVLINIRGTREVVNLAKGMKQLKALIHVSTSFINTTETELQEEMCPKPMDWQTLIHAAETNPYVLDIMGIKAVGRQPNTYTFTKSVAEHIIKDHEDQIPSVIVRPSVVMSSVAEPIPGWGDTYNGTYGLMVAAGKGIIHSAYFDENVFLDQVPVDLVCKGMIIAAWLRAHDSTSSTTVYNSTALGILKYNMKDIYERYCELMWEVPLNDPISFPWITTSNSFFIYSIFFVFFQLIPSLIADGILKLAGKKPILVKLQRRVHNAFMAINYFLSNEFYFLNTKFKQLETSLLPQDRSTFGYCMEGVDEDYFFKIAYIGVRRYLLKESDESLPAACIRLQRVALIHYGLIALGTIYLLWLTYSQAMKWI